VGNLERLKLKKNTHFPPLVEVLKASIAKGTQGGNPIATGVWQVGTNYPDIGRGQAVTAEKQMINR
jgi:hypothetical protein